VPTAPSSASSAALIRLPKAIIPGGTGLGQAEKGGRQGYWACLGRIPFDGIMAALAAGEGDGLGSVTVVLLLLGLV
jgi:hypothetical protein